MEEFLVKECQGSYKFYRKKKKEACNGGGVPCELELCAHGGAIGSASLFVSDHWNPGHGGKSLGLDFGTKILQLKILLEIPTAVRGKSKRK